MNFNQCTMTALNILVYWMYFCC